MIKFKVTGLEPRPQGSKRHVGNGRLIEASAKLDPWRKAVGEAASLVCGDSLPITGAVHVNIVFTMTKPKSVKRDLPIVRPDLDKLCRAVLDAISLPRYFQVLEEDSQVVSLLATKVYGTADEAGVEVVIDLLP